MTTCFPATLIGEINQLNIDKETGFLKSVNIKESVEKKWVFGWEKKGFKDKKNPDLWMRFLKIYRIIIKLVKC